MPANKSALKRYEILDRCLRDRSRDWTMEQMVNEVSEYLINELGKSKGISQSMIEKDLAYMTSSDGYSAPIEKEKSGKEWFWYYSDKHFSITSSPLDKDDAAKLNQILTLLEPLSYLPQFNDLEEILVKLETKSISHSRGKSRSTIQFESNSLATGNLHLRELHKFILKKVSLEIQYQPFGKDLFSCIVSPYLLKEYNNRWFLFGKSHKTEHIQNLALDRIKSFEKSIDNFIEDKFFDPDEYFTNVIGVSVPSIDCPPEEIFLRFTSEQGHYVITKPIHHSQVIIKDNAKFLEIKLLLCLNYELRRVIWGFGDSVTILKPKDLMERQLRK